MTFLSCASVRLQICLGLCGRPPLSVFQLGIFLRALRPTRTVLRLPDLHSALPELKKNYNGKK